MNLNKIKASITSVVMLGGLLLWTGSPAEAVGGCLSPVTDKVDSWSYDTFFQPPTRLGFEIIPIRLTGTMMYWHCPNATLPAKVKPKWIDWCWTQTGQQDHMYFDSVIFDAYIFDSSGELSNPGNFKVGDDGTIQNCRKQNILLEDEEWFAMSDDPRWRVDSEIVMEGPIPNDFDVWTFSGSSNKYIKPANDPIIKGAHW